MTVRYEYGDKDRRAVGEIPNREVSLGFSMHGFTDGIHDDQDDLRNGITQSKYRHHAVCPDCYMSRSLNEFSGQPTCSSCRARAR